MTCVVQVPSTVHEAEVEYEVRELTAQSQHTLSRSVELSWRRGMAQKAGDAQPCGGLECTAASHGLETHVGG